MFSFSTDSETKACLDTGDPTFQKTPTGEVEIKASQEARNFQDSLLRLQDLPKTVKKPEKVEAEAKARVLSEGGDERLVLSRCTLQFGQYKGQTFKWLLENDVGYVAYFVAGHNKEQQNTRSQGPLTANKDSLTRYAMAYPEVMKAVQFEEHKRSLQSGEDGMALVGVGRYKGETLKGLYESKGKGEMSYVNFLRTKKSAFTPGSKLDIAVNYVLQRDRRWDTAAAQTVRKRLTGKKWDKS